MPLEDVISKLKSEHANLEKAIKQELARPLPDNNAITDLKRQKLRIKDELQRLHAA